MNPWPQRGDLAVDYRTARTIHDRDRVGESTLIKQVTDTLVVLQTGEKYNRTGLFPIHEGATSARRLLQPSDPKVLGVKAREHLAAFATVAGNLVDREMSAEEVVGALARLVRLADESRRAVIAIMSNASRAEQSSER